MKKLAVLFVLMVAVAANATDSLKAVVAASGAMQPKYSPSDIVVVSLTDDDNTDANDSLAVDEYIVVGPFALSASEGEPMFKGFRVHVPNGVLASGDSVDISYQMLPGRSITDTLSAGWTVVDTVTNVGKLMAYTDISSLAGQSIAFKIYNLDSSTSQIAKRIRVMFKKAFTYNR